MKIAVVFGTRPEIIKMSPIIKELQRRKLRHVVIHTGQHYDFALDKIFFKELGIPEEDINLKIGSGSHADVTARMMVAMEEALQAVKPDIVLSPSDPTSSLVASLVSVKLHIATGHVESGLRSFDRRLPEEYNRIICDHISDYLFAPTETARKNLIDEGIARKGMLYYGKIFTPKITVTGNTIVDAVMDNLDKSEKSGILPRLGLSPHEYIMITTHREENVDYKENLEGIITALSSVAEEYGLPIIFPLHPRTKKRLDIFGLDRKLRKIKGLQVIDPLGFFELLNLEGKAKVVLTDSGGIQEETCILKTPCVVMRQRTERPEAVAVGGAMLAGCDPKQIIKATELMIDRPRNWKNPFGDGKAARRIVNTICGRE